ncbi:hypothetical protein EDC90_102644 [Martelella mediterranea]|uniref:Uncharacterized protein n=1 Tax=Martelella mediterranea TaxID=293089 RepID=A0A4V6P074_9HYPH|nr:hypothetical protein EDC90_102644 [Martelella mediterranea]
MALLAALGLSACVSSPDEPIVITKLVKPVLPSEARKRCAAPSALPDDRGLSEAEVTSLWGTDRLNLRTCETRRAGAVNAVDAAPETMEADHGY